MFQSTRGHDYQQSVQLLVTGIAGAGRPSFTLQPSGVERAFEEVQRNLLGDGTAFDCA